jgi:outer membrane protein assembly factor BamB
VGWVARHKPRWSIRLPGFAQSSLELASGNRLVCRADEHHVWCLDTKGKPLWKRRIEAFATRGLLVEQDAVYVVGPTLLRLDVATGETAASRHLPVEGLTLARFHPGLLTVWASGVLSAFDPRTLEPLWQLADPEGASWHKGKLWTTTADGDVRWTIPQSSETGLLKLPNKFSDRLAHNIWHGDLLCRFCGPERIAVSVNTGQIAWRHFDRGQPRHLIGGEVRAIDDAHEIHHEREHLNGFAYAGVKELTAINLDTGEAIWRHDVDGTLRGLVYIHDGRLYFAAYGEIIHILRTSDGSRVATITPGRRLTRIVPIDDRSLVVEAFGPGVHNSELHLFEFEEMQGTLPAPRPPAMAESDARALEANWPQRAGA